MRRSVKWAVVAVGAAGIVAAAFVGGRAWAGGIPAAGALTYSGLLQDATGAALSGTQYVEVKFWNDAAASAATNLLCDTGTPTGIGLINGRFSIPLPDACTTKVGSNTAIWAEVLVGAAANATGSLGRAKIGAVPFAVEANHALSADGAAGVATVTGWQPYTPAVSTDQGVAVSGVSSLAVYRRIGDSLEVNIITKFSATPTSGASWYGWSLPAALTIDTSRLAGLLVGGNVGAGMISHGINNIPLVSYTRNTKAVSVTAGGPYNSNVNDTNPVTFATGDTIAFSFTVPVVGWSASQ